MAADDLLFRFEVRSVIRRPDGAFDVQVIASRIDDAEELVLFRMDEGGDFHPGGEVTVAFRKDDVQAMALLGVGAVPEPTR